MAIKQGIEKIPIRIPDTWSAAWYSRHIREVLALMDTRNAIAGDGVAISGGSNEPATISASVDVLELKLQPYILASATAFLPNERILTGQAGFITTTDGGPLAAFTIGIDLAMNPTWTGAHVWENQLYGPLGTASAPTYSSTGTRDSGVYFPGVGLIGLATSSTLQFQIGEAGQWGIGGATYGTAGDLYLSGGASAQPAWTAPAALTRTDDTNVTLTLGGSPTTALVNAASLTLGWTGELAVARGGTGASDAAGARTNLGLVIGTDVEAWSAVLDAYAGGDTPSAFTLGIVDAADAAAWRTAIGAGTSSFDGAFSSLTGIPTTIAGYGITDAYTETEVDSLISALSSVYQPLDAQLTELAGLADAAGVLTNDGSGNFSWGAGGGTTGADPTASIGLTAVNGSATTFLRSDGAPALDQGIVPTWTGLHTFTRTRTGAGEWALLINTGNPFFGMQNSAASANNRLWAYGVASNGRFDMLALSDDENTFSSALAISRSGIVITGLSYGNSADNPPHTFHGQLVPNSQSLSTGTSVPSIGANKPGSAVSLTPSTWWGIVVNGTQYYIPLWQ